MIEEIKYKNKFYAIIIRSKKIKKGGVHFVSPENFTHQVGFVNHPKKYIVRDIYYLI